MPSNFFPTSLISLTLTLSDDDLHPIINQDTPAYSLDIQCHTNSVKLGVGGTADFELTPGSTWWTQFANLREVQVKNSVAGNNGEITIMASIPNAYVEQALRLGWRTV